ncbi:hypothetical protein NEOLEDRAFT_1163066 [Neolentinus lepideus HHB14362 ss-1]|uniref:Auxin efflux carrier n=1 Tax=Neolentinus lepideus HHB14362 ss-1 TaxID=1314782 RepID=A0A165S9V2_9AGAM|nr:hypothetical protein NEOLEDRAFT_1163066 [Neolentinus lepideus HHB14362 ss-1]
MMGPLDTPILPLLKVVFESILEVFILCLAGYILARRGILDKKTQKQLNRVNVSLFTPSLLFSKVAFFLSPAKLRELWIIPIFFTITTVASMIVAYVLATVFRLRRSQRSFAIAAAMFMNSNSLPIALMQSLVITVPGLKWGADDNNDAMVGRALTYLVLHSTMGMVLRWSYGVRLLAQADTEPVELRETNESSPLLEADESGFSPSAEAQLIHRHQYEDRGPSASSSTQVSGKSTPEIIVTRTKDHLNPNLDAQPSAFYSSVNSKDRAGDDAEYEDSTDDDDDSDELLIGRPITEPTTSEFQSRIRRTKTRIAKGWASFNEFMTIPLWAALASIIVALIQPLQHTLDQHLVPVKGALSAAGSCSIPITLVVLGAYFYTPPDAEGEAGKRKLPTHRDAASLRTVPSQVSIAGHMRNIFKRGQGVNVVGEAEQRPGESRTVFVSVLARMIVTPLLLLPLMALSAKFDWQRVLEDPVFVVSNVLLISSPPALTLAQITQAASGDAFERLISRTIFWAYCVVTPPSTIIFVVVGLLLSKL